MLDAGALVQHDDAGAVMHAGALVHADADADAGEHVTKLTTDSTSLCDSQTRGWRPPPILSWHSKQASRRAYMQYL